LFRLTDRWYAEAAASLSHEIVGDFGVSRNGLNSAVGWIRHRECAGGLARQRASVLAEVLQQRALVSFHRNGDGVGLLAH